ncbi:MAG: UPF0149 family protein [Gammaproteobacteria bacterium]|nr:UPF0149 family protein [Gammaproteobacteria bacterium]MBI5615141.1 UPF0149 family protein [Gammaproteobacteria bacterium]
MTDRESMYESVDDALRRLESDIEPAECHGMLCGMLCSPLHFDADLWLRHVTGYPETPVAPDSLPAEALAELARDTLTAMNTDDFSFNLLLPADERPLSLRTAALGGWCRGFLSGFGLTRPDMTQLSRDSREFLADLGRISQVDNREHAAEVAENSFFEIVEYARMGTMLLREETRFAVDAERGNESLH